MIKCKSLKSALAALPIAAAMVFLLVSPAKYGKSVLEGISLWAVCVLPAAFPFLFLSALFTRLSAYKKLSGKLSPVFSKIFKVSGAGGCAAILSALSGYPVGARCVLDLYENGMTSEDEKFRLACLASTTGPMFLVGTVGSGMFSSPALGWTMLLCHFLAVWGVCLILGLFKKPPEPRAGLLKSGGNALYDSLYNAVISILCVGGAIALFYAFSDMILSVLPPLPLPAEGLVRGLMEMTAGCKTFSELPSPFSAAACCFLVTFGGLCVLVQQIAFLSRAGIKAFPFIAVKFLQGLAAGGLCFAAAHLIL